MDRKRKQIVFDIDTKIAEMLLGSNYRNIYRKIENHMYQHGFKHIQGTVYESEESKTNLQISLTIKELIKKNPSLKKCMRDIRQTDISNKHSLNNMFDYDGTCGKYNKIKNTKRSLKI